MIQIAVAGAAGRMGRAIITVCQSEKGLRISNAIERAGSDTIGVDAGQLAGVGNIGVPVGDDINVSPFDVLIEFTNPGATLSHVNYCREQGRAMVIGTTGLENSDRKEIEQAAREISIVFAANMSIGVNLTLRMLQIAASALGESVDVEVIEAHHRHKVDSPSGTALAMGEAVATAWGRNLDDIGVFTRHGQVGPRVDGSIGFATVRAGDIVGEHTVMFALEGERVEISHKASDRMTFANGAIRAARWLSSRTPGLYDMQDVLGLR
ncbi:MAG: 4-hydroxy-tetrahydrodipicolinate reductase [marine bacterium B5-7]|nr:MAG: 4-hydroxy-tetrahydrodipicolinate reductase [marine bacterium B5-7]